ncbi:MFS transporter [Micromonospora sicca]|uniref:MFS transporter n=1 Tax=Micromonospora sicca TaxID=2202420 RepID=UPI0011B4602E|nr:MFS transporter [Micromonospora sp. 4G51]
MLRDPVVRALTLCSGLTNLWHAGFLAMLLVYAVRELRLPATTVGLLIAGANVGYLLGAAVAGRARARLGVGRAIAAAAVLQAGAALVLLPHPLWIGAGLAVSAFASGLYNVNAVSLRQAATPGEMLSRMTATSRFFIWGTMPLGAALGGALTGLLGAPAYLARRPRSAWPGRRCSSAGRRSGGPSRSLPRTGRRARPMPLPPGGERTVCRRRPGVTA